MKLTPREKWMLAILPAALTGLSYYTFSAHPASLQLERLRKQVASLAPLTQRQAQIRAAQGEHAELLRVISERSAANAVAPLRLDTNLSLQLISKVCAEHGLMLLSSAADTTQKLPQALLDAAPSVGGPGLVWRLELRGPYSGVVEMLEVLEAQGPLIVPLSAAMQKPPAERLPLTWVLTLWL